MWFASPDSKSSARPARFFNNGMLYKRQFLMKYVFNEVKRNLTKLTNNKCAVSWFSGQRFLALARLRSLCSWTLQCGVRSSYHGDISVMLSKLYSKMLLKLLCVTPLPLTFNRTMLPKSSFSSNCNSHIFAYETVATTFTKGMQLRLTSHLLLLYQDQIFIH